MLPIRRVGIFGGTFDPPHIGHLILAAEAWSQLELDRLLWMLTPAPPHKQGQAITPLEHRLGMVKAAIHEDPAFELSRLEIDRPGPHYAVDTARLAARAYPGSEVYYLVGGDSLRDMPTWHDPQGLVRAVTAFGVMRRPDAVLDLPALERDLPGISGKLVEISAPLLDISSREIRRRAAAGEPFRYYLPPAVYAYIWQHGLYGVWDSTDAQHFSP